MGVAGGLDYSVDVTRRRGLSHDLAAAGSWERFSNACKSANGAPDNSVRTKRMS